MVLQLKVEVLAVLQMDQEAMLAEFRTAAQLFSTFGLFAPFAVRVVSVGEVNNPLGFQEEPYYQQGSTLVSEFSFSIVIINL